MDRIGVRGVLRRPVSPASVVCGLGLAAVYVAAASAGHPAAAVFLVAIVVAGVAVASAARSPRPAPATPTATPAGTYRLQETVRLPHPAEEVWALIMPAEHTPLLSPHAARGYRVPGTPEGLGEQQATVALDGTTTVAEVVEYVAGRHAVTKPVSPPEANPARSTFHVEPLGDGCLYMISVEGDLAAGFQVSPRYADSWREHARDHFDRVRRVLDGDRSVGAGRQAAAGPGEGGVTA